MNKFVVENGLLYQGDNLEVLKQLDTESVDLVYLDPPFNKGENFEATRGSSLEGVSFKDKWHENDVERSWVEEIKKKNTDLHELINLLGRRGHKSNKHYLIYITIRLFEVHRVLKPTGSLYFHCDQRMTYSIKLVLDFIFGHTKFKREIAWRRSGMKNDAKRNYPLVIDSILFYVKGENYYFQPVHIPYTQEEIEEKFPKIEYPENRRWRGDNLRAPSHRPETVYDYHASNGKVYKPHPNGWSCTLKTMKQRDAENRLDFPKKGASPRRWNSSSLENPDYRPTTMYDYHASNGKIYPHPPNGWKTTLEKMKQRDKEGRLHFPKKGQEGRRYRPTGLLKKDPCPPLVYEYKASDGKIYKPDPFRWVINKEKLKKLDEANRLCFSDKDNGRLRYKVYADEVKGRLIQNLWDDFYAIGSVSKERAGYPTQKPIELLRRIIQVSCPKGGVVLDPFCGSGTTGVAIKLMNEDLPQDERRTWIGVDILDKVHDIVQMRLNTKLPSKTKKKSKSKKKDQNPKDTNLYLFKIDE